MIRYSEKAQGDIRAFILIIITISLLVLLSVECPVCIAKEKDLLPRPQGYVSDFGRLLSAQSIQHLEGIITYLNQKTGAEVAVVTLKTISPDTIEDYAVRLFEKWGIGQKDKDNGVLILVAVNERKIRIEVGYGLEGVITDGTAGEIIREIMTPAFKQGRFDQGLLEGTEAVLRLIAKEYSVALPEGLTFKTQPRIKTETPSSGGSIFTILMVLFLLIFFLGSRFWPLLFLGLPRTSGSWSRGGGSFGGGFGGFGGGMSGGGGATGGW